MDSIKKSKIQSLVKKYTQRAYSLLNKKDIVLDKLRVALEKAKSLDPKLKELINNVTIFIEIVRDYFNGNYKGVDGKNVFIMLGGILYFLNPLDLIPDVIPILGFTDDAAVLLFILGKVKMEITKYKDWKSLNSQVEYES